MIVGNVVNIDNGINSYNFLNNLYCNNSCCPSTFQLSFEIFEGNGNVFAIIDERIHNIPNDETRIFLGRSICANFGSIRIDGVLFLQPSNIADIKMRIFEKDGTESDMCGNGLRCIAKYIENEFSAQNSAQNQKSLCPTINIETNSGVFSAQIMDGTVKVEMGTPQDPLKYVNLEKAIFNVLTPFCIAFSYKNHIIYLLNSGEPHGVMIVDDINKINLTDFLDFIKNKEIFPFGINLNAMQIIDNRTIRIRTLERGLWAATSCCGTGSTSCATLMRILNSFNDDDYNTDDNSEIKVISDGGSLYISFSGDVIFMRGSAKKIECANYQVNRKNK